VLDLINLINLWIFRILITRFITHMNFCKTGFRAYSRIAQHRYLAQFNNSLPQLKILLCDYEIGIENTMGVMLDRAVSGESSGVAKSGVAQLLEVLVDF